MSVINIQSGMKYILGISLMLLSFSLWGQRSVPKYDNLVKEAMNVSNEKAFNMLNDYRDLAGEKASVNVYFLLAEKGNEILREIDPILEYPEFNRFAGLTIGFYEHVSSNLTETDIKKDRDFFFNVPSKDKKIGLIDVQEYVQHRKQDLDGFILASSKVQSSYNSFYRNYIQSFNLYSEINNKYIKESDFLASDYNEGTEYLRKIVNAFDSALYYAESYKDALIERPTKGYVANFSYKPIENYRQDGFSKVDLTNGLLWNYGDWAKSKNSIFETKIKPINSQARKDLQELTSRIANYPNIMDDYRVNPNIYKELFQIDATNPLINKLQQGSAQFNFFKKSLDPINNDVFNPQKNETSEKVNFCYDLTQKYLDYRKVSDLIEGLRPNDTAVFDISVFRIFEKSLTNFKRFVVKSENHFRGPLKLKYKKEEIALSYTTGFYRPTVAGYVTKAIVPVEGGYFLSGSSVSPQGFSVAYIAYSIDGQNITWIKTVDIGKVMYDDCAVALSVANNLCFALITSKSVSDPSITTQTIISYNLKGEEKGRITLPEKALPIGRFISYNPEKETLLLAFYGDAENWFQPNGKLIIQQIDKQNMLLMRSEVELNGELTTIMEYDKNFLVVGNAYSLASGEDIHESEASSAFSLVIDKKGVVSSVNIYSKEKSYYCIKAFSAKNETTILIGEEGIPRKNTANPLENKEGVAYLLIDNEGSTLNSNYQEKLWIYEKNVSESL